MKRRGGWGGACTAALAIWMLSAPASAAADLRVRGNQLVDGPGAGHVVQIRGVNRSGLEYTCIQGYGFFDSPHPYAIDDPAMIAAMKSWDINAVRVPLNEDCWLGLNTAPGLGGAPYRSIVRRYVAALHRAGLYVILDLHVAAPGTMRSVNIVRMPDADHAPAFWRSVAATFKNDRELVFDLYNEPHDVGWSCWLHGCQIPANHDFGPAAACRSAGMQQLVDAVRSTGARQPLMAGGLQWALDLSGWVSHVPRDPVHKLLASEHNYGGLAPCFSGCRAAILSTHRHYPVVFGELGETDCRHRYVDAMMRFADAHRIAYLGWTWDAVAPGSWSCRGGPSLIRDYRGTPTPFGIGFRDHLRALGVPFRP
ncbi:MAG: glycoside hydrolase family 5 protein [Actinomycetota bacterium]|nr:glycoside hydrolase family 5 protein [Actinomycetota bacterium]